jgi:chromosome segregation ATPase
MDLVPSYKTETDDSEYISEPPDNGDDSEEEMEQEPMTYLPSDHPLLERFQRALKDHLLKVQGQLEEEIAELDHSIKEKDEEIADVGSKLYDLQIEIEQQRDQLDKYNKQILEYSEKRKAYEDHNVKLKKEFEEKESSVKESKRVYNEMLQEISNLNFLQGEISKWNEEVRKMAGFLNSNLFPVILNSGPK